MRRINVSILIILIVFFLSACSENEVSQVLQVSDFKTFTIENENFRVKTFIDKLTFMQDEEINIYSMIEYIGENKSISIWSGIPYFHHTIYKGQEIVNGEITFTTLNKTILNKGEIYTIPFIKNGGFDSNDPNAEFMKKYLEEEELKLPKGEYIFSAKTAFTLDEEQKERVILKNEFIVKVN